MTHLYLRADATSRMGTGHLMRCLSLAEAASEQGISPFFFIREAPAPLLSRLKDEGISYHLLQRRAGPREEAEEVASLIPKESIPAWIILDGYHFGKAHQSAYRASGLRVLAIDDYGHAGTYDVDLVLNPNLYASMDFYPSSTEHCRFLLGADYALLRREFRAWRTFERTTSIVVQRLLVTMGGADPTNVTGHVLKAVDRLDLAGTEVIALLGSANPHRTEIVRQIESLTVKIQLLSHVDEMATLLAGVGLAVSAAGGTTTELLFMQVPAILIPLPDDNQRRLAEAVAATEAARYIGDADQLDGETLSRDIQTLLNDRETREKMARRGRQVIDGNGAHRVITRLREIAMPETEVILNSPSRVELRAATVEDEDKILQWRNDPWIVSFSRSQHVIAAEEHRTWFRGALTDPAHDLRVVVLNQEDIGLVRLHRNTPAEATLSIYLMRDFCGKGHGTRAIQLACEDAWRRWPVTAIIADTLASNAPAARSFEKSGFKLVGVSEDKLLRLRMTR